jgi:hypothetical protein
MSREEGLLFIDQIPNSRICIVCANSPGDYYFYENPEMQERGVVCKNCDSHYINRDFSGRNYKPSFEDFEL